MEQESGYKSWTMLDLFREMGRLRKQQYASMAAYESEEEQGKVATQADEETEILAEIEGAA